jgi:hypothetical protein
LKLLENYSKGLTVSSFLLTATATATATASKND